LEEALHILKQYWGYDFFRPPQNDIIASVTSGRDTIALLPTGGGKSVCYQVPALMQEGICVVISPLIALMEDQVHQLRRRKVQCLAIHSGMSHREIDIALDNCVYGQIKLLYVSPERLQTELFQERFKKMKVSLVAIDEAHCISQWGYDFRPPYLKICELREWQPRVPFIALTATATPQVLADIADKLQLKNHQVFQKSFARENISLAVRKTENKDHKLLEVLKKVQGSAIVYTRSRKATQETAAWLHKQGIPTTFYHAGLSHEQRSERQKEWIHNHKRVMVATNAFGMGIDKEDVRVVVHLDLPENPESYYQEAGRAGRDGKKSFAVVICHEADILALQAKIHQSLPSLEYLKKIYQALSNYYQLAFGAGQGESFDFEIDVFCERFALKPAFVYPALKKLEEEGLILLNESFYHPSTAHILADKQRLYEFQVANAQFDPVIKTLLRSYGASILTDYVEISESTVAHSLRISESDLSTLLKKLSQLQIIHYIPTNEKPQLTFVLPRQDANHLPVNKKRMDERRELITGKMNAMIDYVNDTHRCRMNVLQEYFGEQPYETCGVCDVCIDKKKKENLEALSDYKSQIFYLLRQKNMTVEELESTVNPDDHHLFAEVIREMIDHQEIAYDDFWVLRRLK